MMTVKDETCERAGRGLSSASRVHAVRPPRGTGSAGTDQLRGSKYVQTSIARSRADASRLMSFFNGLPATTTARVRVPSLLRRCLRQHPRRTPSLSTHIRLLRHPPRRSRC